MTETSFTPYRKPLDRPNGPNSWVFFAVAKLSSGYQPVAAVSSVGGFVEKTVRYGIVGFPVAMVKFVPSLEAERRPFHYTAHFDFEEGPLRVLDEVRPRKALSAAEYMAKFKYDFVDHAGIACQCHEMKFLESVPLVDNEALSPVWASAEGTVTSLPNTTVKPQSLKMQQDEVTKSVIQKALHCDDFDISVFDHVRHLPGFKAPVQQVPQECRDTLGDTRAVGRLIRLASIRHDGHLNLELLEKLSANIVSIALDGNREAGGTITSLSLCIDSIDGTPDELATALSGATSLKEICLLQNPSRESDALSAQILTTLVTETEVLSRAKVVFACAYSSALRQRFWLPSRPCSMPRHVFPIQQILARQQCRQGCLVRSEYDPIYLEDGLLKPERFAAGSLLWLSTLGPLSDHMFEEKASFLPFSSAPASLTPNLLSTAEVTPILCENFALPFCVPDNTLCSPRVRDLEPGTWTALVSRELNPSGSGTEAWHIRYAFVRVRRGRQSIVVEDPPASPPGPDVLEVVGLKELLSITAPEVDPSIIDVCLDNTARSIVSLNTHSEPWPSEVKPLSVFGEAEAAEILLDCLSGARTHHRNLRKAMKEDPEYWS